MLTETMGGIKTDDAARASVLGGLIMVNHVSPELSAVYIRYLKSRVVREGVYKIASST